MCHKDPQKLKFQNPNNTFSENPYAKLGRQDYHDNMC